MKTRLPCLIASLILGAYAAPVTIARGTEADARPLPASSSPTNTIHQFEGTLRNVNVSGRSVRVKNFWSGRLFEVGNSCEISLQDKPDASISDLIPGQKVNVTFKDFEGVRVATRIMQTNVVITGPVLAIDVPNRTFRVKDGWFSKIITAGPNCTLILRDGSNHPFKDLKIGQRVTVKYITPETGNVAQEIQQRSLEFSGRVDALDARTDTIRVSSLLTDKTFRLGNDCQIVVDGKLGGELKDLRIGDRISFHYDDVDGVLVANRIERESTTEEPKATQLSRKESPEP